MAYLRSKDRSRTEREKLREMNFREKLEYIWSYYNYYIIGGGVAIAATISLLTTCLNQPDIGLSIEWGATYIEQESFDALATELTGRLFAEGSGESIQSSINLISADDPSSFAIYYERMMAMLAAQAIDIFFLDLEGLIEYSYSEFLLPLDNMLSEIALTDLAAYERIMEEAVNAPYGASEEANDDKITGIRITDSPLLRGLPVTLYGDAYLCVAITTGNYENVKRTLVEFFTP